ncbi:DUF3367 domain-containing protein [Actinomadura madurae]|nr:alpha-(1->3)-arabinofuranosyltransferase family protein [Actinomadura madurae]MCP9979682.1 DUF3367 domain-containing protein [Actinomadura madurae]
MAVGEANPPRAGAPRPPAPGAGGPEGLDAAGRLRERIRVLACCLTLTALAFGTRPGAILADTKIDMAVNPLGFLGRALHLWDPEQFGQLQNQAVGYLFPMGPFFALGDVAGMPAWVTQRFWLALLMCLAFVGTWRLAGRLGIGGPAGEGLGEGPGGGRAPACSPRWRTRSPRTRWPRSARSPRSTCRRDAALDRPAAGHRGVRRGRAAAGRGPVGPRDRLLRRHQRDRDRRRAGRPGRVRPDAAARDVPGPDARVVVGVRGRGDRLVAGPAAADRHVRVLMAHLHREGGDDDRADRPDQRAARGGALGQLPDRGRAGLVAGRARAVARPAADPVHRRRRGARARRAAERLLPERTFLLLTLLAGLAILSMGHISDIPGPFADRLRDLLDGPLAPLRNLHKFDAVVRLPLALGLAHVLVAAARRAREARGAQRRGSDVRSLSGGAARRPGRRRGRSSACPWPPPSRSAASASPPPRTA